MTSTSTSKARSEMANTWDGDVAAYATLNGEGLLPELVAAVASHTRGDDGDVESLAYLHAARHLVGDGERNVMRAARAGVRQARRTVAAARTAEQAASDWLDESASTGDDTRTVGGGVSRNARGADKGTDWTPRDLAHSLAHALDGTAHGAVLADACRAYMTHTCATCEGVGRRPSLPGILAHTRGLERTSADAWALRRLTLAALAALADVAPAMLAEYCATPRREYVGTGAHVPFRAMTRADWTPEAVAALLDRARADDARRAAVAAPAQGEAPATDVVTVRVAGQTFVRTLTDAEQAACERPTRERVVTYAGEAYGESSHRANVPAPHTGQVPTGKRPAPRKAGKGTTGPTVPARLTR